MQKYLLLVLLTLSTTSRTRIRMDRFTGCTTDLFPNPSNFRGLQIKFDDACTAFETCAASYNKNQEECIDQFEIDQIAFCDQYTSINLWRRRYCKRIVTQNMVLARKLADDKFKNHVVAFEAQITDATGTNCLINGTDIAAACTGGATEFFDFIRLGNDKYVIKNSEDKCLNGSLAAVECDFDDEDQQMEVASNGTGNVIITNDAGNTLSIIVFVPEDVNVDPVDPGIPAGPAVFDSTTTVVQINVVA